MEIGNIAVKFFLTSNFITSWLVFANHCYLFGLLSFSKYYLLKYTERKIVQKYKKRTKQLKL